MTSTTQQSPSRGYRPLMFGAGLMCLVVVVVAAMGFWQRWQIKTQLARGLALYEGRTPIAARLVGHELDLPPMALRCANCHEAASGLAPTSAPRSGVSAALGATPVSGPYASTLNVETLSQLRVRRGGPPSRFDAASLCKLLREGIDPASVLISTTMPRYDASPQQCEDLWTQLISR